MKVDDEIERASAQTSDERQFRHIRRDAAGRRRHDDLVNMRIVRDDGLGGRFDEIRDVRPRVPFSNGAHSGRGEHDVADLAKSDQENAHPNRQIHFSMVASSMSMTGMSSLMGYTRLHVAHLRPVPLLHERHRGFAVRTRENFEQLRVDGHGWNI